MRADKAMYPFHVPERVSRVPLELVIDSRRSLDTKKTFHIPMSMTLPTSILKNDALKN